MALRGVLLSHVKREEGWKDMDEVGDALVLVHRSHGPLLQSIFKYVALLMEEFH